MAAFVGNSLLDVRERNSMAITLNIHTKSHTVRGRPTLKLVERFGNGSVRELYERSIYERSFTSEPFIEKYQAKPAISNELSHIMFTCKHNRVFRRDREPSRIPEATLKRLRRKGRKLKEFVYERIRPSIPKSSWLRRYVKVRKVTKSVCKFNTKRVRLNKVTQHEKKYLLNCSVRVYQRIIKLKCRASRYLSLFSCNRPMCLNKSQTHVSNYCKFQLSSDIEKNPDPTPMYIDPSKTITAPYSQANELVFEQNSVQQCVAMSLYSLIYNNKLGINSADDLVSIMNTGNRLYSSSAQLTRQSFLMQTELLTLLNVLETDYELQYSESYTIHQEAAIEGYQYCTSLDKAFQSLISENFNNFVLTIGCSAVAIYCKGNVGIESP